MKIVTFTRDVRPFQQGNDAVLPDDVAARVIANGEACDMRPFPPPDVAPQVPVGKRPILTLPRRSYPTRKRG